MVDYCLEEWDELEKEFLLLEEEHKSYSQQVSDVKAVQRKCTSAIAHQRYRIKQMSEMMKRLSKNASPDVKAKVTDLEMKIAKRKNQFRELEDILPHENGIYLKIVLGSVNVSLLSKQDKFKYKEDYERFKLYVTIVLLVMALVICFVRYRVTDAVFQFTLVWYYCTLTIREHILRVNGSRIKGWWITHHFISTAAAGILLIWPDGFTYHQFRAQFVIFSVYLNVVQMVQYYYQSGSLYRLRALGERRSMDLTVEGFQSWMWKGLSFLLPLLIIGYGFQLYNAYILFDLSQHPQCLEWQVLASSVIFFILFLGNTFTVSALLRQKIREKLIETVKMEWRNKYHFNNKVESNLQ